MTEKPKPIPQHCVTSWEEANELVQRLTEGGTRALGAGNFYPEDFTLHYKDSWSGEGTGYRIWKNEDGRHKEIFALVNIGEVPDYRLSWTYVDPEYGEITNDQDCSADSILDCITDMRTQGMSIVEEKIFSSVVDPDTKRVTWNEIDIENFPDYL